jgi:HlyD family secretion protein
MTQAASQPATSPFSTGEPLSRRHPSLPPKARPIVAGLVGVLALSGVWFGLSRADAAVTGPAITASGTIEGEEVTVSAEAGGRIRELPLDEGAAVAAGALLARLDDTLLSAQLAQARAAVEVAEANLRAVLAGARHEEIAAAGATRDQAAAALDGARAALANATRLRDDPQELTARIDAAVAAEAIARARLAQLQSGGRAEDIAAAEAAAEQARTRAAQLRAGGRTEEVSAAEAAVAQARARLAQLRAGGRAEDVAAAQAQVDLARTRLSQVEAGAREEEQRRLRAGIEGARAQVAAAQARLAQVAGGPRSADLAAARAQLDQAETRLAQLREGTPRSEDVATARLAWEAGDAAYRAAGVALSDAADAFAAAGNLRNNRPPMVAAETAQVSYVQAQQALHQAEANLEQRRAARDQARAQYDKALAGPSAWEVRLGEEAVALARAGVQRVAESTPHDVRAAEAQVTQALAAVEQAEAQLAAARQPGPFDVEAARIAVAQAEAQRDRVANPSAFDVAAAEAALAQAEAQRDRVANPSAFDVAAAEAAVAQAEAVLALRRRPFSEHDLAIQLETLRQAETQVRDLRAMRDLPLQANAQVDAARAHVAAAEAALAAAQARLDAAVAGPTAEQIAIAEAQVRQAQAAAGVLAAQLEKLTSTAPRGGVVTRRMVRAGETVSPGTPLLTLADLDTLTFTVYVGERDLGQVRTGQPVDLEVDAYPGQAFRGEVSSIGTRAEFTPRNVQTKQERANLVFAVKVRVANPDGRLKPGMPVDARLKLEQAK